MQARLYHLFVNSTKLISCFLLLFFIGANGMAQQENKWKSLYEIRISQTLQDIIKAEADWALHQSPITVTAAYSNRSAGGRHDFFSEGDYWWPNPLSADSPYIQKDGLTNPANFTEHRLAMIRFSRIMGALASAYRLTGDRKYVLAALKHCKVWFLDTATMMNPNLLYAQAIKGRFTGRGIGIIDTIQFMEVVQALLAMENAKEMDATILAGTRRWFAAYLQWLQTHPYGKDEKNAENNHGTCWVMQVACFARFTKDTATMKFCRERYMKTLLPNQMAIDGSFPRELKRTKPYGYALFNLDAFATICQILSTKEQNLWAYETGDGKSMEKGIRFMFPYVNDKQLWPFAKDVMYWDQWPVAQPFLVFGAVAFHQQQWLETWARLNHSPDEAEVIRNLPVRHPFIWF